MPPPESADSEGYEIQAPMHIIIFHPDPRLTISTLPAPAPHPPTLRSIRHLCSADFQPRGLIKL